ncbi:MAG: phosphoglucomutase/phosphomannomutase family protein [Firmicutes bacterium]|nr:phosphoglucomutase/phosphomannomutase family protein [Bacillota bacterium]
MGEIKFGTDGWRAVMCDTFTFSNVRLVAQAIADYLRAHYPAESAEKGVLVGYDSRFLAERFADEAARVLAANGIRTLVTAVDAPTPVVAHAVVVRQAAGALMFTASHNPPEYNGLKFIPDYGGPAAPEITREIEERLDGVLARGQMRQLSAEEARASTLIESIDPRPDYLHHLSSLVDFGLIRNAGLRVIYDPMYGTGRHYLGRILTEAGCQVRVIHGQRDPLFGGLNPEPTEEQLAELTGLVKGGEADLGLATDGDADRFGVIDSQGRYITPNQVISLLLAHLAGKGERGGVARTVATTHLIDRLAVKYGLAAYETPVGFKHICQLMREKPILIGGEESGGLSIGRHIPEKDGILACLLVAELRAAAKKPLAQILDELMREVGPSFSRRIDIHLPEERKRAVIENLKINPPEEVGDQAVTGVNTIDGVKVTLKDGSWFLARPSGTEPLLRIYVEAGSEGLLQKRIAEVRALVEA